MAREDDLIGLAAGLRLVGAAVTCFDVLLDRVTFGLLFAMDHLNCRRELAEAKINADAAARFLVESVS